MTALPSINALVTLRDEHEVEYQSRVENIDDGRIIVGRPMHLPAEHDMQPGTWLLVTWPQPNGVQVLPTNIASAGRENSVGLWTLEVVSDGWREQRRAYVRAPFVGTVAMQWKSRTVLDGQPDEVSQRSTKATLVDLSEAGMRCSINRADWVDPDPQDATILLDFTVMNHRFTLTAELLRVRPHPKSDDQLEIVVVFFPPVSAQDDIRRLVFAQQVLQRRVA